MSSKQNHLKVTELDFDQIKANLIQYLINSDSDFTDWDIESSNLNSLLDMLSYNTHYNAHLANMSMNETYLESAQLRSSVSAISKMLGYLPASMTSASVNLEMEATARQDAPEFITLNRGTVIQQVDETGTLDFTLLDNLVTFRLQNGLYKLDTDISDEFKVYEGRLIKSIFEANGADTSTRYEIDDEDIDISTLVVHVYPNNNLTDGTSNLYQLYNGQDNIGPKSLIYYCSENSAGKYEIQFGNGSYGAQLRTGNIVEIEYLRSRGSVGNGKKYGWKLNNIPNGIQNISFLNALSNPENGIPYGSSGGSDKETLNRLKENAAGSFIAQRRAVTADDYRHLINSQFNYVQNVSVWGGENNIPPIYGKTFCSILPHIDYKGGEYLTPEDKKVILEYLNTKKVLSILPEIIDPQFIQIKLDIQYKYDPNIIRIARGDLNERLREEVIGKYSKYILEGFNSIFRHSEFSCDFDNSINGILNNNTEVYVYKQLIIPQSGYFAIQDTQPFIDFGVPCVSNEGSCFAKVSSDLPWTINGDQLFIGNQATPNPNIFNLYTYTIDSSGNRIFRAYIGAFNLAEGRITFTNNLFSDDDIVIEFTAIPTSRDIVGARNLILQIDPSNCRLRGYPDEIAERGPSSGNTRYQTFPRD